VHEHVHVHLHVHKVLMYLMHVQSHSQRTYSAIAYMNVFISYMNSTLYQYTDTRTNSKTELSSQLALTSIHKFDASAINISGLIRQHNSFENLK